MTVPQPFLRPPFLPDTELSFTAGWEYEESEIAIHGVKSHGAVDFAVPQGTPVLAAESGLAIATYGERLVRNEDGSSRKWLGKDVYYGSGLMIQIWHGRGRYTQYLHLDSIAENILYYPPREEDGDVLNASELRVPVKEYGPNVKVATVKAGDVIGYVGSTGLGWGRPIYPDWTAGKPYESWDVFHLHFAVFGRRSPNTRNAERWDPFGIYGKAAKYPTDTNEWAKLPNSLWLP